MERKTQQREAILAVIRKEHRPLSPQEIHALALEQVPKLGVATVYRAIKTFLQEGVIIPVDVPGQPPRYEQAGLKHHHHFFCTACDRVFEMEPGCPGDLSRLAPEGFQVRGHHLTLTGRCSSCREPDPSESR